MENIMSSKLFTTRQGTVLLGVIAAVIAAIALIVYLNHYRNSVKSGGALAALKALKEKGTETSGTQATAASQIPAIQAAITKGANALIVSATDASALCPTLKQAMARKIAVVTYDSDAPGCRSVFINQADSKAIGTSQVDLIAKQIGKTGEIAVVSAAASATNQNAWIAFMKQQVKKYPKVKLVDVVYGNDDPTVSTQVTQGLDRRLGHG